MDTKDKEQNNEENTEPVTDSNAESTENKSESAGTEAMEAKIKELNDKYLRLYSEFDNYRKRTIKERSELIKTASEEVLKSILPVMDDLERAIKANETVTDISAVKDGIHLIYNKLKNSAHQNGLVAFESIGQSFDSDIMEAITNVPATEEAQKGKVIDEIEKGYKLGDKVIRFAKVVIAQ